MGKGFQNFMSKKDFHPSAIWNLKKVFMARQQVSMEKNRQDELRAQYDKEQEVLNNKALLGDEKARLGLAFMYELPAGLRKEEKDPTPALEPKFEWQRKYNAPREAWAKGDDSISDQPFGIQVRNVRCVKCHTWGHVNTDRDCPLYNMSGNKEEPGSSTNPSDIIRDMKRQKVYTVEPIQSGESEAGPSSISVKKEKHKNDELIDDMKTEYGLALKRHIVDELKVDEALEKIDNKKFKKSAENDVSEPFDEQKMMFTFLRSLSDKERAKIFKKFYEQTNENGHKRSKKHKKEKKSKKSKSASHSTRHEKIPSGEDGIKRPRHQEDQWGKAREPKRNSQSSRRENQSSRRN